MPAQTEVFWRQLPGVRSRERKRFLFFAGLATLISIAQTLGLASSEALFLVQFGAEWLPVAFIGAALTTVLGSMMYAVRVGAQKNDWLFVVMLAGSAVVIGVTAIAVGAGHYFVVPGLFCFYYLSQAVFVNHLWTFTGDFFDTVQSKRLIPLFTIGASVGGVIGGVAGALMAKIAGLASMLAGWAVLLACAALMINRARHALHRWGPLEAQEADETSVEGVQAAMRYVGSSRLGRWLSISAMSMMLSLFVLQYIYSDIFAKAFDTPERLAQFFGIYLAITNVIEIAIEVRITPWLIKRFGVPAANLIHPLLTLASFGGLAQSYGMMAALGGRMNRELIENAFAGPLRALLYNAMPQRHRGRTRAFLEGVVVYAGMALAGVLLLIFDAPDPMWLCATGGAMAALYFAANLKVRREYVRTLVKELRAGRLDLDDLGDEVGQWETHQLAELWEQLLANDRTSPSRSLLQLIPSLASRGHVEPLIRAASHPHPAVRRSCINALAAVGDDAGDTPLYLALDDENETVRLAALRGLIRMRSSSRPLEAVLARLLDDPAPTVRAEAAANAGEAGEELIELMIRSDSADDAIAALHCAPASTFETVLLRAEDPDPDVRAAALECIARSNTPARLEMQDLLRIARDENPAVRRAGVLLLANIDDIDAVHAIAGSLGDSSHAVQFAAETVLGSLGETGIGAVEPLLRAQSERIVESALRAIKAVRVPASREVLKGEFRHRVHELWRGVAAYQHLPTPSGVPSAFLELALADDIMRNRRLAFSILELVEDRNVVRRVEKSLQAGSAWARGDALEVLSHMGDREAAGLLVLFHETGPLTDRLPAVAEVIPIPTNEGDAIAVSRDLHNDWVAMAGLAVDSPEATTTNEVSLMERLLALKQVPLFSQLSLEQLEAVQQISSEVEYLANETIVKEGEPGGELYLLIDGKVRIYKGYGTRKETLLSSVNAISYFGEMAALDDQPRSATVIAAERSRMLRLDGESLKELIRQMPEISLEIMRILTGRVRRAESRLTER
jgi:HEAT repeat protein